MRRLWLSSCLVLLSAACTGGGVAGADASSQADGQPTSADAAPTGVDAATPDAAPTGFDAATPDAAPTGFDAATPDGSVDGGNDCDGIPAEALALFQVTGAMGASNTPGCGDERCGLLALEGSDTYYAVVVMQAWQRLHRCVDYEPSASVAYSAAALPTDATLVLSLDGLYHSSGESPAAFRQSVAALVSATQARTPGAPVFIANIPEEIIQNQEHAAALNMAIADEIALHPSWHLLDMDFWYGKLIDGKVVYNGVMLDRQQVFFDPVHLTSLGQRLAGDLFIERINEAYPGLAIPTAGELVILD